MFKARTEWLDGQNGDGLVTVVNMCENKIVPEIDWQGRNLASQSGR